MCVCVCGLSYVPLQSTGTAADAYFFCQLFSGACLSNHSSTLPVEIVLDTIVDLFVHSFPKTHAETSEVRQSGPGGTFNTPVMF